MPGSLPLGDAPMEGNLLPNAGFEIGRDGWFTRGPVDFVRTSEAIEGKGAAVMHGVEGQDILSSTFLRLSFRSDYLAQVRVKALTDAGQMQLSIAGSETQMTVHKADGWQTLTLRFRPRPPSGKIVPYLDEALGIECQTPGAKMLVDAASVQAVSEGRKDPAYAPKCPLELGLTTDAPEGTVTIGDAATITALSSGTLMSAALQIRDEEERVCQTLTLHFHAGQARLRLPALPPGYWHLIAVPNASLKNSLVGETFLAVLPPQPNLPAAQRMYGTHIIDDPAMRSVCMKIGLRWDRLHDTGNLVKWPTVQPDQVDQWIWHDEEAKRRTANGTALLGNLDGLPVWAAKQDKNGQPLPQGTDTGLSQLTMADEPLWEEFCRRTAAHYRGQIETFEILNEASFTMTPGQYVHLEEIAWHGLHAGNPNVKIVASAVAGSIDDSWLLDVVRLGGGKYCDAISYHGYGLDTWASLGGPEALLSGVSKLRAALATAAMFAKSAACVKAAGLGRIF